ncbi:MAG TPA: hypothetical protein DGZ24_05845 [Rhodospirillaceae bacterium]|nr:hypothetical protein [Candidatus Neomarinimicrobiota bacterium]HCX14821.1 hypothetical protein [Rhodospirillaceae bacterium]
MPITQEQIVIALKKVDSGTGDLDIVTRDWVKEIVIDGCRVTVILEVPARAGPTLEPVRADAEKALRSLPEIKSGKVVLTAQIPKNGGKAAQSKKPSKAGGQLDLPDVKFIIAVASGKGGVGKSTTAANIAVALARLGPSVAVFDADIFGPSMPRLFGLSGRKPNTDGKRIIPLQAHGIKLMSIGFMIAEDDPIIWRGPMIMGALEQMFRDVAWGKTDVMIVDMPPGTGDTQLTISQRVPLAGAVIVSTPQDIALLDARKGLNMFKRVEIPILGIIENMSYHLCAACGHREEIFDHGGACRTAEELGAPFLGEVPLDLNIRTTSDEGLPIVMSDPDSPHSQEYMEIARKIWAKVSAGERKAPTISIGGKTVV